MNMTKKRETAAHKEVRQIPAGIFKAECLRLMDEVARRRAPIVITKHGKPVAKLVPVGEQVPEIFGCMAGTVTIHGDIIEPIDVEWEADAKP